MYPNILTSQYVAAFTSAGLVTLDDVLAAEPERFDDLGVKRVHEAKIIKAANAPVTDKLLGFAAHIEKAIPVGLPGVLQAKLELETNRLTSWLKQEAENL